MATPSEKSPEIEEFLDQLLSEGRTRVGSIKSDTCASCGGDAHHFRDAVSVREYHISGLCQGCQDSVFGTG